MHFTRVGSLPAMCDEDACAQPFPTFTHRIVRGESSSGSLLDTSRGVVTATRSFPALEELDFKKVISFGRRVGELTELISMLQLTSLFLCSWMISGETSFVWKLLRLRRGAG